MTVWTQYVTEGELRPPWKTFVAIVRNTNPTDVWVDDETVLRNVKSLLDERDRLQKMVAEQESGRAEILRQVDERNRRNGFIR